MSLCFSRIQPDPSDVVFPAITKLIWQIAETAKLPLQSQKTPRSSCSPFSWHIRHTPSCEENIHHKMGGWPEEGQIDRTNPRNHPFPTNSQTSISQKSTILKPLFCVLSHARRPPLRRLSSAPETQLFCAISGMANPRCHEKKSLDSCSSIEAPRKNPLRLLKFFFQMSQNCWYRILVKTWNFSAFWSAKDLQFQGTKGASRWDMERGRWQ